jgi:hypothetical protein
MHIFVVGAQKLVPDFGTAPERIYVHSLKLEDARAYAAYGQNSVVGSSARFQRDFSARSGAA